MYRQAVYAAPLSRPQDERAAVALAAALAPSPDVLDIFDGTGTAPTPTGGRRSFHPIIHRAGWLVLRWAALAEQQEGGRL
jgi:hypothetical protein